MRRLALTGLLVMCVSFPTTQLVIGTLICSGSLFLSTYFQPYADKRSGVLHVLSEVCILIVYYMALLAHVGKMSRQAFGGLLTMCLFIVFAFAASDSRTRVLEEAHIDPERIRADSVVAGRTRSSFHGAFLSTMITARALVETAREASLPKSHADRERQRNLRLEVRYLRHGGDSCGLFRRHSTDPS